MEAMTKNLFSYLAKSNVLNQAAKKWGLQFGANKVVGGETFAKAVPLIRQLNKQGLSVTVDHLGEFVSSAEISKERTQECVQTIKRINHEGLDSQISLKLTSLGLDIDHDLITDNLTQIMEAARHYDIFITIDMEDTSRCQATLDIFEELRANFDNLGTVIQSYLYRSEDDVRDLNKHHPNLRLVKGAYKESSKVAYKEKDDVDENLKRLIKTHLLNGNYTAVASHDDVMINYTKQIVKEYKIPSNQFEFQMLYGMRTQTQLELAKEGYKMRVYVPYGDDWYGYFMRRLAERPENISFVLKGMFKH
ncbi:L-proline dehydrogenase [Halobacillus dabanensis]|uniref:proline dehydrogenase n=1 Tax=Halobacillus dabanensis TaxID=240302 RepID=A0A1I3YHE4_HALDA|nr:proline dehydrogenase [Halobacillus dabanensis]SFK31190.1 L-proline dehydrogenase [Halobacillus dabanensis]